MENQNPPPIRPWFRLASTIRVEPPQQSGQPRPPLRPTLSIARPATISQPEPQPQPQPQPQLQPPPAQQPTQAPTRAAPPLPVQGAEPRPPSPTRPLAPASPTPSRTSVPSSPMKRSPLQQIRTSVPTSPVPQTAAPPPMPKISPPQPKVSPPASPKRSTDSPPKSSPMQKSPPRPSPKAAFDEYFKLTKPSSVITPPHSPKTKPLAPPPSPLSLPPSQMNPVPEPESKTVVMAEPKNVFPREQKEMKHDELQKNTANSTDHTKQSAGSALNGGVHQKKEKEKNSHKKSIEDHEEDGIRVITIAGDNKGAYMELGSSKNKLHTQNLHKNNPRAKSVEGNDSSTNSSSSSDEVNSKKKGIRKSMATTTPTKAFVNSNVQGVNNSILFNSSCTHSDPGVHLLISRKPTT